MGIAGLPVQCSVCNRFGNPLESLMTMTVKELSKAENEREFTCTKCIDRRNQQTCAEHAKRGVEEGYKTDNFDPDYQER